MTTSTLEQTIRTIIVDNQRRIEDNNFIERDLTVERIDRKATIITGMRRSGKSVYLTLYCRQLLLAGVPRENLCIIDFSDDRLFSLRSQDPAIVADSYYGLFPNKMAEKVYFFFDEIQYLHHWELFVNRLQNGTLCEINITGSSARLLVKEIATEFGGRSLAWELYPFSFSEYVRSKRTIHQIPSPLQMGSEDIRYVRQWFDEYITVGGIPESLMIKSKQARVRYLQDLAYTVVFRDVVERFKLTNPTEIRRLMQLSLQQMGGLTSFSKLKQRMAGEGYRISATMIRDAIDYFEDAYLIHTLTIFSTNISVQATNPKKFYCADHALAMALSEKPAADLGKILENVVFLHLKRNYPQIYYAKTPSGKEVDFVTLPDPLFGQGQNTIELWQVCYAMEDEKTLKRETEALYEAMATYNLRTATIITYNTQATLTHEGMTIEVVPAWRFLLSSYLSPTPSSVS